MLLIDTNVRHDLADGAYADRRAACERAAAALGVTHLAEIPLDEIARIDALPEPEARRARHVITEQARVADAVRAFADADVAALGRAFAGSHRPCRATTRSAVPSSTSPCPRPSSVAPRRPG